jgi:hypothetical protein
MHLMSNRTVRLGGLRHGAFASLVSAGLLTPRVTESRVDLGRRRPLLRVALVFAIAVSVFCGVTGSASAGAPPNRLDDNRGAALTVVGLGAVQLLIDSVCPLNLFCGVHIGGRVQSSPRVFDVYWDDNWDANNPNSPTVAQLDTMVSTIAGGSYLDRANQYGVSRGGLDGSHQATAAACTNGRPGGSIAFATLLSYVTCEVQVPGTNVPYPNDNTTYSIFLPEGTTVSGTPGADCSAGGSAAFHSWSAALTLQFVTVLGVPLPIPIPVIQGYPFTVVPATCAIGKSGTPNHTVMDGFSELFSHEFAEASIDPFPPTGWVDNSQDFVSQFSVGEPADICQLALSKSEVPTTPVRMINGYVVGTYWSNADNACVPFGKSFHLDETGLPGTISPTTATVNGQTVKLPFNDNFEVGSSVSYSFPTPVSDPGNSGIRYVTPDSGFSGTISNPVNDVATYTTQYLLTTATNPGFLAASDPALTPSGWHSSGELVTLNTTTPIPTSSPGDRYRFDYWSGDATGRLLQPTVTMSSPKTATANYQLQHKVYFDQTGIASGVPWNLAQLTTPNETSTNDVGPYTTWVDHGLGEVNYSYQTPVPGSAGVQYVLTGAIPATPFTVYAATNVLGTFKTQFRLTVNTTGLGANLTHITNSGALLGTASDPTPLLVWIDSGTVLALKADADVDGAAGVQYFFQNFTAAPPATMIAPFTTTARYETMAQLISDGINSGGIYGPSAGGLASTLTSQFAAVQTYMAAHLYADAIGKLTGFVGTLQAQQGKEITRSLASTFELDAMLVYHNALCKGVALRQISQVQSNNDYLYYSRLVTNLGGTVLPPC